MKLFSFFAGLSLVAADACYPFHHEDATAWKGLLGTISENITASREQVKAMNLDPNLSKCIGSMDITLFDALAVLSDDHCDAAMKTVLPYFEPPLDNNMTLAPKYAELQAKIDSINADFGGDMVLTIRAYQQWLYNELPEEMFADITALIRDNAAICLHNGFIPMTFQYMFDLQSGCCDDMKADFKFHINREFTKEYLQKVLTMVLDLLFTVRDDSNESCMRSMVKALMNDGMEVNLKHALSIPHSQACPAATGSVFKSHVNGGSNYQFENGIGCCAYNVDAFLSEIKQFPQTQHRFPKEVFALNDYDCTDAIKIPIVQAGLDTIKDPALRAEAEKFLDGLCLHFASEIGSCGQAAGKCSTVSSFFETS